MGETDLFLVAGWASSCADLVPWGGFRDASSPDPEVRCLRTFLVSASSSDSALDAFRLLGRSLSTSLDLSLSLSCKKLG